MRPVSVIAAPSDLGLKPTGVTELPRALRSVGMLRDLPDIEDAAAIGVPAYQPVRDSTTGVLNPAGIRAVSQSLAGHVERSLDSKRFPLVLGGDCSILLGIMLALRQRGRYGLLFLDGHCDFYSPESEPNGEVASMELAMVTGREPQLLGDLVASPLVREDDVVAFGVRDADAAARNGSPDIRETSIRVLECSVVQQRGVAGAAREAVASLEARGLDGFWLHLDADVLNDAVMPAVDYRMPGGLGPDELAVTLQAAFRSEKVIGMDITIYNPLLDDATLSAGRVLAGAVASALAAANDFSGPSPAP